MLLPPSLSDLESFWSPSRLDDSLTSAGQVEDSEKDGDDCTEDREDEGSNSFFHQNSRSPSNVPVKPSVAPTTLSLGQQLLSYTINEY